MPAGCNRLQIRDREGWEGEVGPSFGWSCCGWSQRCGLNHRGVGLVTGSAE